MSTLLEEAVLPARMTEASDLNALAPAAHPLRISLLGTTAMLFEAPGQLDLSTQQRIWSLARLVESWPEIAEAVPGMANLMLTFRTPPTDIASLAAKVRESWEQAREWTIEGKVIELLVQYGGEGGPHLQDVVAHTGLSVDEVVHLHAEPLYTVYALGSHPGYCYLGGMNSRIATPRRQTPVVRLPGGSVSIGGVQTGVSASQGPSGWNTIGSTSFEFFDATRDEPARLAPGDTVQFVIQKVIR